MSSTSKIVTICGGGHLGHVCAGFFAAQVGVEVRLLTRRPELWDDCVEVTDPEGEVFRGKLAMVTANPAEALCGADIILLCLPGFSIREVLENISPYLEPQTVVGAIVASTGFFFHAHDVLKKNQPLFGFQRVPFISRMVEYGKSASLLGYKSSLFVAIEQTENKEKLRKVLETLFCCPVNLLENFYEASLSNSNPLLHTSRLFSLWNGYKAGMVFDKIPFFYKEWTVDAAELYIAMDCELQALLRKLGVREGAIPDVLTYYGSTDAESLARKLRSITAFQEILAPMIETHEGFVPDFKSRYFTEDFALGLSFTRNLCHQNHISCPTIDKVYTWGEQFL